MSTQFSPRAAKVEKPDVSQTLSDFFGDFLVQNVQLNYGDIQLKVSEVWYDRKTKTVCLEVSK